MFQIGIAIVLAVLASLGFALGATCQHLGIEKNFAKEGTESRALTFKRLLKLLVTPMWIGGLALIVSGAGVHIVALALAPLTVVQPLGILAVPFSILLANRIFKRTTSTKLWGFVIFTVIGIVGFTVLSAMTAAQQERPDFMHVLTAAGGGMALSLIAVLMAKVGPKWMVSLSWAWAGAILYGLGSGFIKLITVEWGNWNSPLLWGSAALLALVYSVGGWEIQQAYATGPAEVVVGVMTTVDPVVAVTFGLLVLNEGRNIGLLTGFGMVIFAAAASIGVGLLSKHHPEAQRRAQLVAQQSLDATQAQAVTEG